MAVQQKFNALKSGPKEDKVAVASGVAIAVVVVLLAAWAIFFLRNVSRNSQELNLGGGIPSEFNFTNVTDAQEQLKSEFGSQKQDLESVRDQSQGGTGQMQTQQMQVQGSEASQFKTQNPTY